MKYILKKGILFVLMVALVLSLAPTAFAAESTPVTSFGLIAWENTNAYQSPYTPTSMSFDEIYNQFLSTNAAAGIPSADMPILFDIGDNQVLQLELRQQSGELGLTGGTDATIMRNTRLILGGSPLQFPTSYTLASPLILQADLMIRSEDNNGGYATLTFEAPITVTNGSTLLIDGSDNSGSYMQSTFNPDIYINAVESGSAIKVEEGGTLRIGAVSVQSQNNSAYPFVEADGGTVIVQEAATLTLLTSEYKNGIPTLESTNDMFAEAANISMSVPLIEAIGNSTVRIMGGDLSSTGEQPIIVFDEDSTGTLLLEGGNIDNKAPIEIPSGVTLEIPAGSTAKVINTSSEGHAISLANGANVKMNNTTVTANGDTGNYIDNNGVAVLAAGATNESNTLRAAVMLTDGTIIEGSETQAPTVTSDNGTVTVSVPAGGAVTSPGSERQEMVNGGSVNQSENGVTTINEEIVHVDSITLDRDYLNIYVNGTATLNATVVPANANDKTVTWDSSDDTVATVDENGNVKALKPGTTTITASAGGLSATCIVTVSYPVNIPDTYDIELIVGEGGEASTSLSNASAGSTITVTVTPDEGYELDYITVDGERISGTTFTMPDHDVTVRVYFTDGTVYMPFVDVNTGDWFYDEVAYVYANGLMDGVSTTQFNPNGMMTRAMVWAILARVDGETVTGESWIDTARAWAMSNGVSDGENANGYVTREQLATMLWRYAGEPASSYSLSAYTDAASVSDWAQTAMAWAVEHGIITGMTDTTIEPQGTAIRAQCAAMLMRFVEL